MTVSEKPILPVWIMRSTPHETLEDAGFASGAALALLHLALHHPMPAMTPVPPVPPVPVALLRQRLALKAAVNGRKIEGKIEEETGLRDAYYLTKPGDARGPGGDRLAFWSQACQISLRTAGWQQRLGALLPEHTRKVACDAFESFGEADILTNPIARAAQMLSFVLNAFPRDEAVALLLADVTLARALGWSHVTPGLAIHLTRKQLIAPPDRLHLACHAAVIRGAQEATRLAHDLTRRAARLRAIAPKLRSKGSAAAIDLFLTKDAVSPSAMLSPKIQGTMIPMTDRSARRLCDRLVELGVVRELTGRATFRLYGVM